MDFYTRALGLQPLTPPDASDLNPRLIALDVLGSQVLLLFRRGGSNDGVRFDGGFIPGADAQGTTHFAFAIEAQTYDAWKSHMQSAGVAIESEVNWERGGRSLYFRDPDGHLVELATPGLWRTY
jgi:catechol 2,3-dioxygenase-like lactoylglutathione lyase family enzyme